MAELVGSSQAVEIAPFVYLTAPGLVGSAIEIAPTATETRSERGVYEENLLKAQQGAGLDTAYVVEMDVSTDFATPGAEGTRSDGSVAHTREGEPAATLSVPSGHAALYTDEAGISRWLFPSADAIPPEVSGAEQLVHFNMPLANAPTPAPEAAEADRGLISKIGRRLVRVFTWATDGIVGQTALAMARSWENQKRKYGFLRVQETNLHPVDNLEFLGGGPALLLLHGTFSNSAALEQLLKDENFQTLAQQKYGGRVVAFDHPSMHHSPSDNISWFLEHMGDTPLELDFISHSRGGLVGRVLAEQLATLNQHGRDISVKRAVMVASPNRGTRLADGDHWIDWVDRHTNLLTDLPDNVYTLTMEGVMLVIKLLAHGSLKGLPGLSAFTPGGDYITKLNQRGAHTPDYYAIAANFEPTHQNPLIRIRKMAMNTFLDSIFGEENDGVVPTRGAYDTGNAWGGFPVPAAKIRSFTVVDQVHHCNYFAHPPVNKQLHDWLMA